jgi:hypothetical protein
MKANLLIVVNLRPLEVFHVIIAGRKAQNLRGGEGTD